MSFAKKSMIWSSSIFIFIIAIALSAYLSYFRWYHWTTDAYVTGQQIPVNSQISSNIESVFVEETNHVKAGQLLVTLDSSDAFFEVEKARNALADEVRNINSLIYQINQTEAMIDAKKAMVQKATYDFNNRAQVVDIGSIAKEDFEHAQTHLAFASAELISEEFKLLVLKAQLQNSTPENHPRVELAKTRLKEALLKFKRTRLYAPVDGIVAKKTAMVGKSVSPHDTLMYIIPLDQIWIDANFKETKLKNIRIGQKCDIKVDMWGSEVIFHGTVQGQNAGTGSVFSIIPPQNATGNWIKIVQRLAVRIKLDPEEIKAYPLWLGLTTTVKVDTRNRNLPFVTSKPVSDYPFITPIYDQDFEGYDAEIRQIINQNWIQP